MIWCYETLCSSWNCSLNILLTWFSIYKKNENSWNWKSKGKISEDDVGLVWVALVILHWAGLGLVSMVCCVFRWDTMRQAELIFSQQHGAQQQLSDKWPGLRSRNSINTIIHRWRPLILTNNGRVGWTLILRV